MGPGPTAKPAMKPRREIRERDPACWAMAKVRAIMQPVATTWGGVGEEQP